MMFKGLRRKRSSIRAMLFSGIVLFSGATWAAESEKSEFSRSGDAGMTQQELESVASTWGISVEEYKRYQQLMKTGMARYVWQHLDPVMVLGLSAETDAERARYAELYVGLMRDQTRRELEWERAYQAADKRLYADSQQLFNDRALFGKQSFKEQLLVGDQVFMIVESECKHCVEEIIPLLDKAEWVDGITFDFYVVGVESDEDLFAWAASNNIPVGPFQKHQASLNAGNKFKNRLKGEPYRIYVRRDGEMMNLKLETESPS